MKKISLFLAFAALAVFGLAQTNIQKGGTAGPNSITQDFTVGSGRTITVSSGGTITISSGANFTVGSVVASSILDAIGTTRGAVLYKGASGWAILAPGTSGYVLKTNGAGADPSWVAQSASGGTWGTITGTLSNQTDLQTALNLKANLLSPSFTTPTLGVALATSINGLTITTSTGTITIANGKTATFSNSLTFTGTDASSVAFGPGGTVLYSPGSTGITTLGTIGTGIWNATAVGVQYGGTGLATATAYSPIFAGTTGTGTWKADTGPGTNGYVLTSNGAGAYPTWQASGGGGTSVTAATAAASAGLIWISGGPDRSAVATSTVPEITATTANVTTFTYGSVTFTGVTGTGKIVADTAPQISTIELGAASDTTLARSSAGNMSIEGNLVYRAGGTDIPVTDGGTGLSGGTSGGIPYFSSATAITSSAALAANAIVIGGGAGVAPSTTTTGSGVLTAIGINTGTAGAFQVNNASGAALTALTAANISAGALAAAMTATTQSVGDNDTSLATTAYADTAAKATLLGSYGTPNTAAGAISWTSPVYEVWTNTTTTYALPAASTYAGKAVIFYAVGTNLVTIDPNASEVIVRDGTAQTGGVTMTLSGTAGNFVCMVCDGARWITLGYKGTLAAGS